MRACHRLLSRGLNCSHEVRVDAWLPKDAVTRSHLQSRGPSRCAPAGSRGRSQDRRRPPFEELEACATARVAPAAMVAAVRPAPSGSLKFQVLSESLIQSFSIPMGRVRSRARTVNVATHSSESLPCCRSRRAQEVVCRSRDGLDVTLKALAGSGSDAGDLRSQLDQVARFRVQKSLVAVAVDYSAL